MTLLVLVIDVGDIDDRTLRLPDYAPAKLAAEYLTDDVGGLGTVGVGRPRLVQAAVYQDEPGGPDRLPGLRRLDR